MAVIRFEVGKHYDGSICLARRGRKETWVYLPPHKEGQPIPEYWPRGKSGLYCDWYRVRVVNDIECAGPDWNEFRADNWMTDKESALAALQRIKDAEIKITNKRQKRKSKKQVEREEYEESCRMAREFYSGVFRAIGRGIARAGRGIAFIAGKYRDLFKWMFSRRGYSSKDSRL